MELSDKEDMLALMEFRQRYWELWKDFLKDYLENADIEGKEKNE